MKNIIYILAVFALCFGFKAQAQKKPEITEYNIKLNSLPDTQAQLLNSLVNGAPSMIFINGENKPTVYQRSGEQIKMMMLQMPSHLVPLLDAYKGELDALKVINIEWNGTDNFTFPTDFLAKLPSVEYVYIRSYQNLSQQIIENNFQQLVAQINQGANEAEILYSIMEQPQ